jgi:tRNA(fMet)-specific endonuclease VapC
MPDDFILLDTDVFISLTRGRRVAATFGPLVEGRLLVLTFVSVAELWRGAYHRGYNDESRRRLESSIASTVVVPPTDGMTHIWARITDAARRVGKPLGQKAQAHDAWIAAAAIHHDLPLLTGNTRHFQDVDGLDLVKVPVA